MTPRHRIPETTVARLPVYLRSLLSLADGHGPVVSSEQLAQLTGLNSAKVRKDLAYVGATGTRGVGYDVSHLVAMTARELRRSQDTPVVIVGMGQLGRALAAYQGFTSESFRIQALFDIDRSKLGQRVGGVKIRHLDELVASVAEVDRVIGVITTSAPGAQRAADALISAGVRAILNFAPASLAIGDDVWLRNVDVSVELQILAHHRFTAESHAGRGGPA